MPQVFTKTGQAARKWTEEAQERAESAAQGGTIWRFRIKQGDTNEFPITFLDGNLTKDEDWDGPASFFEHTVHVAGKWMNLICTESLGQEPCPVCAAGNNKAFVTAFTVIDHTAYTKKDGTPVKNQRKLFIAKYNTCKQLHKLALKRDGLAGARFDVSRSNGRAPAVGDMFDFVNKLDLSEIHAKFGDDAIPLDYNEVLEYKDRAALLALGAFGPSSVSTHGGGEPDEEDLSAELGA